MASQTTTTHKREQTLVEPRNQQMRERLGFDRRGIRRELAASESLSLSDKYIEQEDRTFINPATTDLPYGPSEMGETGGSGVEMYTEEGDTFQTYRFHHGFSVLQEDLDASNSAVADQRDEVVQIFDYFADAMAMAGITDRQTGSTIKKGVLQYLKDNIPSDRTFDLENYDGDTGDEDYTDNPENVLFHEAFQNVSGNLLNDSNMTWDTMLTRQEGFSKFNWVQDTSGGADRDTYWNRISNPDAVGGVQDYTIIPNQLEYPYTPEGVDPLVTDLTSYLGPDEAILLPDMDVVSDRYWKLYEMDEPDAFPMHQQGGGKMRQDYAWRYSHVFNPEGHKRWGNLEDAVHLRNLSALFGDQSA